VLKFAAAVNVVGDAELAVKSAPEAVAPPASAGQRAG
jgi:hypothetical protein